MPSKADEFRESVEVTINLGLDSSTARFLTLVLILEKLR